MRNFVVAIALMVVGTSVAAQPVPNVPAQPVEFVFKLKPSQVDVVGKALGKLPFEEVAELVQALRQQIVEQQQASTSVPKAVEKKK